VVVAPQRSAVAALRSIPRAVTAVAVECDSIDAARRLPAIGVDQRAGARLAATHLLELGHQRVWHVAGPADWLEARERTEGWRTTLHDAGLSTPPVLTGDWSARSGYRAGLDLARRFRADPDAVTAVFAANDHMALGVIRALQEHRIRVPEDISVVGFDDIPGAAYLSPPLTTVHQDFDEMGRRCVAALLRLAESDRVERPIPVAPTLVLRASTAAR
jgi:DNA-binding LacI/PurR family transcriptional regulator